MKKILNEWRKFINENELSHEQIRIELGKKMNSILFKSLDPSKNPQEYGDYGPDILKKYKYLYSSIYGTKAERESEEDIYRPEMGYKFVEQKVNMFLSMLSPEEKSVLKNDIPQLVSLLRRGDVPEFAVQLPVEKTGHSGVDPSFKVPVTGRKSIDDWGMGGSIRDTTGDNYIFHVLDSISNKLPASMGVERVPDEEIRHLYFMSETKDEYAIQNAPSEPVNNRFSSLATSGMSYEDMVAMLKGKK
tara:strand:- start:523 stop:1260 length:738 start_codon:yes stop_codon:yes gene_type:complete